MEGEVSRSMTSKERNEQDRNRQILCSREGRSLEQLKKKREDFSSCLRKQRRDRLLSVSRMKAGPFLSPELFSCHSVLLNTFCSRSQ